jgi:hypothetical protein
LGDGVVFGELSILNVPGSKVFVIFFSKGLFNSIEDIATEKSHIEKKQESFS